MKKSLLTLSLLTIVIAANELQWVEEQVKAIKPKRDGISNTELTSLHNPFIFLEKNKIITEDDKKKKDDGVRSIVPSIVPTVDTKSIAIKEQKELVVYAIINQSALIGTQWYKIGDTIRDYKVKNMGFKSVTLVKKNKELVLTTHVSNSNIKFNNK